VVFRFYSRFFPICPARIIEIIWQIYACALIVIKRMFVIAISIARYASRTINIRDLPLSGKLQSDLIQLEQRTPGVGVENGITPCRLSACSMLSSVEATLVGGLLPLFSQYRTDRG
jgi:hypothetical protein